MNRFRTLASSVLTLTLLATVVPQTVSAQSFFSTGIDGNMNGFDDNWLVSTGSNAFVAFGTGLSPANVLNRFSEGVPWIANTASGSNTFGLPSFTFRQSFDLTGFNVATASLTFRWGCDDVPGAVDFTPVYFFNGGAASGSGTCGSYALGNAVTINSGFVAGMNTLEFRVRGNATTDGMVLQTTSFTATRLVGNSTVPEPSTVALLAAGLLSIAGVARRRRVKA